MSQLSLSPLSKQSNLTACETRLKQTEQLLTTQEKMAAIGLLTAGIAHEIKNPLNFINNFSKLNIEILIELKEEIDKLELSAPSKERLYQLIDDIQVNFQKIQEHGARAENTVHMMLLQARQENTPEKESVSINKILEEYANLAYHGMRATNSNMNAKFEKNLDQTLSPLNVFPQSIGRVFLNIINNGLYAANQKKDTLSEDTQFVPTITLTTQNDTNNIIIKIKDNGIGIPESQLKKIFEPLFSTKQAGQGTGLGLTICQDIIVKEHGGQLEVKSVPGEYTEFTIILPK